MKKDKVEKEEIDDVVNGADVEETSDVSPEGTDEKDAEGESSQPKIEDETQKRLAELQDKYLRSLAEFDNYRKRTLKEKAELILNGGEKVITALLPVLDDMERALKTMENAEDVAAVRTGIELIFQKFVKILSEQGVKKIETADKDFDINVHEAIAQVPVTDDEKKGKIVDCVETGYMMGEKIIRHAKVAVGV